MTNVERDKILDKHFGHISHLVRCKGEVYSGSDDILSNFKRNSAISGMTPYQVWLVYASKHWDCITSSIRKDPSNPVDTTEGLPGRIADMTAYLFLLQCLLDEKE